jgi:Xylose isomerase-like TIM barrel
MVADKVGVHNIELQHAHFFSTEPAYLKDLKERVAKAKSQIIQINTEFFQSNASSTGPSRVQSIDLAKQWIDHAEALGCPRVMVNAGSLGQNVRATAIDALKTTADYAKAHKVTISIENTDTGVMPIPPPPPPPTPPPAAAREGGDAAPPAGRRGGGGGAGTGGGGGRGNALVPPATWQAIAEVAQAAGVLVTPNLVGFPNEAERAAGLKVLYPLSNGNSHVSVSPGKIDLAAAIKISQGAGYKGLYTIVTDGAGDPSAATKAVLDEILKLI